jgi:hypothetical protein
MQQDHVFDTQLNKEWRELLQDCLPFGGGRMIRGRGAIWVWANGHAYSGHCLSVGFSLVVMWKNEHALMTGSQKAPVVSVRQAAHPKCACGRAVSDVTQYRCRLLDRLPHATTIHQS